MIKCRSHVTVSSVQRNVSRWLSAPTPVLLCLFLAILGQALSHPPSQAAWVPGSPGRPVPAQRVKSDGAKAM